MPPAPASITAIVPALDQHELTRRCVDTLVRYCPPQLALEIIVVDDGSREPYVASAFPSATVLRHETPRGYVEATNRGVGHALAEGRAGALLLLNNDIEFRGGGFSRMVRALERFDLSGPFGRFVPTQRQSGAAGSDFVSPHDEQLTPFIEFCCVLVRAEVFRTVGLLDARFAHGYYSDDDFCLRCQLAGLRIGQIAQSTPHDPVHHVGGTHGSARRDRILASHAAFLEKWGTSESATVRDYLRDYLWNPQTGSFGKLRDWQAARAAQQ